MRRPLSTQFRIRTLLTIALAIALFLSGYRIGHNHGERERKNEFNRLIQLIADTVPGSWIVNGGDDTLQTEVSTECFSHGSTDVGSMKVHDTSIKDTPKENPFDDVHDGNLGLNPFQ